MALSDRPDQDLINMRSKQDIDGLLDLADQRKKRYFGKGI